MEKHSRSQSQCAELLAQGKVARAEAYPCGHLVLTFDKLRVGFAAEDFRDFAHTVALASQHLQNRESERAQWGLFMD